MVDSLKMQNQLILHEGLRLQYYTDTLGNITWGVGFNVTARGVNEIQRILGRPLDSTGDATADEVKRVLTLDIQRVQQALLTHAPWVASLSEVRQRVFVDLAFNIGLAIMGFKRCLQAASTGNWSVAAIELHKAHWAQQVESSVDLAADAAKILNEQIRGRADRLAKMLLTGVDYAA